MRRTSSCLAAKTPRLGPPKRHRHAEPLPLAHHDVGAEARRAPRARRGSPGSATTTAARRPRGRSRRPPRRPRGSRRSSGTGRPAPRSCSVTALAGAASRSVTPSASGHRRAGGGSGPSHVGLDDLAIERVHAAGESTISSRPGDRVRHQRRLGQRGGAVVDATRWRRPSRSARRSSSGTRRSSGACPGSPRAGTACRP